MTNGLFIGISVAMSVMLCAGQSVARGATVRDMKCEYRTNPPGIDVTKPRLSWKLESGERGAVQTAYQILVSTSDEALAHDNGDLWDSGKVDSDQSTHVIYAGSPLKSRRRCSWKVRTWDKHGHASQWSKSAFWSMGLLEASDWKAKWIGLDEGEVLDDENRHLPARMLRRELIVDHKIKRATAYMCGLGLSELYINGSKIGDHVLSPGLTDYNKRELYVTYDVTKNLNSGVNAVGVILGNGRYFAPRKSVPTATLSYGYPKLLLQMEIEYDDGSMETVASDESWKLTDNGPIRSNNEYDGEVYDATKEMDGWSKPGYVDSDWQPAKLVEGPKGALSSEMAEPIRVMDKVHPVAITNPRPSVYIFDMGQNLVGWCRLKVKGPRGTRVYLKHAEKLTEDGSLYLANLRSAKVTDQYVLSGKGSEVYEPRFTYHGFRYVEVTGYPGKPDLSALEGIVIYDSLDRVGEFSCSSKLINSIYRNIYWGIRGNYRSIPTDCPQRDERQGWFGDRAQVAKGEMYVFDTAALQTKWIRDMEDSQLPDGSMPDIAPAFWTFYTNSVTFPTAAFAIPGHLYTQYGDSRILETHYDSMKRWIDMMSPRLVDGIMPDDTYGDWCVPPEKMEMIHSADPNRVTNKQIVSTAYFCGNLRMLARYASVLGKTEDAARYNGMADKIKVAFNAKFFNEAAGVYDNGTQTSSILPLNFGLVPDGQRQRVFANLVDNIVTKSKYHIGTGMIGCQWIMRVLSDNGRADVAYKLASQTSYPSWGYMVENGATTVWELWNGDHGDPAMNSGNHVMQIGDLCTWLHEYVAGIAPDGSRPGFKHIIMRPQVIGELTSARATHESPYGTIVSDWKLKDGVFAWRIKVPANTTATVYIPASDAKTITESSNPANSADGVKFLRIESDRAVFELGSGRYSFESKFEPGKV